MPGKRGAGIGRGAIGTGKYRRSQAQRVVVSGVAGGLPFLRERRPQFGRIRAEGGVDNAGPHLDAHVQLGVADGELQIRGGLRDGREAIGGSQDRGHRPVRGGRHLRRGGRRGCGRGLVDRGNGRGREFNRRRSAGCSRDRGLPSDQILRLE